MLHRILYYLMLFSSITYAATSTQWRSRSIYQILTDRFARTDGSTTAPCDPGYEGFCGGTWAGITQKLDYIQGMGFDAIWISPVVEQVSNPTRAYHGYCAKNIYSLNDKFGNKDDLKTLAKALHDRDMYLMVDVVPNHMAFDGNATTTDYSTFYPFNDRSFFHNVCFITDWTNVTQIQRCWLGGEINPLPDLDTTLPEVRTEWNTWIKSLVANYSIDGIRVDTAQNIEESFFPAFGKAAGSLRSRGGCQLLHAVAKTPFNREAIWLSGYNTDGELYKFIKKLNAIRKMAIIKATSIVTSFLTSKATVVYYDAHNVAFAKGPESAMVLTVINNNGAKAVNYTLQIATSGFAPLTEVVELLTCTRTTVGLLGNLTATVTAGRPMVFYPYSLLGGTSWCGL
ncbi:uncharacterized protein N0V89_007530 [Didymosphaeria variabile]|uniref:alpha-amylase n=1 Tax=Didymosphaeria variabile TaxID=1932322 RepID=A0A9W8XJ13_9PLEO|nr:uncharacterized protein N0V89_007530 [Didymosphaeria variabile]KAJ4352183.1 hypothetical protein N0V89_007530 [Didymosphaeria variabile]